MMREHSFISSFKIFLRILVFILCMFAVSSHFGPLYKTASAKNEINKFTEQRFEDFYNLPKNSLDAIFLGSSHAYCSFDPANFEFSSFQLGTPLQHPDTSYYLLKEVLNYQKPKLVVVEIYWDMLDDSFNLSQVNAFFEVLRNDELKNEYINKGFPLGERIKYKLLPIRYQQEYFAYEAANIEEDIEKEYDVTKKQKEWVPGDEYYTANGYVYCDIVIPEEEFNETNQFKSLNGKYWKANEVQLKYIDKISELAKEEGIELIFVTAPVANVSMEYIKNYDAINSYVSDFCESRNIKYLDYNIINLEEHLFENLNFRDDAHLNDSGVKILNAHFNEWLKENVSIY